MTSFGLIRRTSPHWEFGIAIALHLYGAPKLARFALQERRDQTERQM